MRPRGAGGLNGLANGGDCPPHAKFSGVVKAASKFDRRLTPK